MQLVALVFSEVLPFKKQSYWMIDFVTFTLFNILCCWNFAVYCTLVFFAVSYLGVVGPFKSLFFPSAGFLNDLLLSFLLTLQVPSPLFPLLQSSWNQVKQAVFICRWYPSFFFPMPF